VISLEMKLEKNDSDMMVVKKLLFLYSIGTEFYDSKNNIEISEYYVNKTVRLITSSQVLNSIEKGIDLGHDEKFKEEMYKTLNAPPASIFNSSKNVRKTIDRHIDNENSESLMKTQARCMTLYDDIPNGDVLNLSHRISSKTAFFQIGENEENDQRMSVLMAFKPTYDGKVHKIRRQKKQYENNIISEQINSEVKNLQENVGKVEEAINSDIEKQHSSFEEKKKLKKRIVKKPSTNVAVPNFQRRQSRRGSKYDIIIESLSNNQNVTESDIMKDILEYSEKQMKLNQDKMQKEIDDFMNKNIREMNEAVEEIRFSYTEDMKDIDENVFPEIMEELKSDMHIEIENLKEKYDELRNTEVEKIKAKYLKE